jgi:hypothetical protein
MQTTTSEGKIPRQLQVGLEKEWIKWLVFTASNKNGWESNRNLTIMIGATSAQYPK